MDSSPGYTKIQLLAAWDSCWQARERQFGLVTQSRRRPALDKRAIPWERPSCLTQHLGDGIIPTLIFPRPIIPRSLGNKFLPTEDRFRRFGRANTCALRALPACALLVDSPRDRPDRHDLLSHTAAQPSDDA